jgi:AcrR family transcriptional regulator
MNKRRRAVFTREELYRRVWSEPLTVVARNVGLSSNALTKICNRLLVPYPPRGYWPKKHVGKSLQRPPLPAAPDGDNRQVTLGGGVPSASRRARTRLGRDERRLQLVETAEKIIAEHGLHAASMKRIAAQAGISETQAYNYFRSRDELLVALARREFAQIRDARRKDVERTTDHYSRVIATTRTYLKQMSERGGLLQTLLSSPEVRALLREEHRQRQSTEVHEHAQGLVDLYGIPRAVALGCTVVLTTVSLRAGKLISDKRISLELGERLCLSMILQGSRDVVGAAQDPVGVA